MIQHLLFGLIIATASSLLQAQESELPEVKLSPSIRISNLPKEEHVIPLNAIRQFLAQHRIVDTEEELDTAPSVTGFPDGHISGGAGNHVFIKGVSEDSNQGYDLFRKGQVYKNPLTGEILGYEAIHVAKVKLESLGEPAVFNIIRSEREVLTDDRLLPLQEQKLDTNYHLRRPKMQINSAIIGVMDGVTQIGQYQIVVLDTGKDGGLEVGHLLNIYKVEPSNPLTSYAANTENRPQAPKIGEMMILRTFTNVSYAIVLKASQTIHVQDEVKTF